MAASELLSQPRNQRKEDLPPKNLLKEARPWPCGQQSLCAIGKNRSRNYRFVAGLQKHSDGEAKRVKIQGNDESTEPLWTEDASVLCPSVNSEDSLDIRLPAAGQSCLRDIERKEFEPKIISIGPLHRGQKSLSPMENVKSSYQCNLLDRIPNCKKEVQLTNYKNVICRCSGEIRKKYSEITGLSDDELVHMLILDGCFLIECFLKVYANGTNDMNTLTGDGWNFSDLRRDLMLFVNQIPFFVLVELFNSSNIPERTRSNLTLVDVALHFLSIKLPVEKRPKAKHVLHLLHLYHLCFSMKCSILQITLWPFKKMCNFVSVILFSLVHAIFNCEYPGHSWTTKSATALLKADIQFGKKDINELNGVDCPLKVSLSRGMLGIPFLKVEDSTSSKLRNLVALEQCCPKVGNHFTRFVALMGNMIIEESDVAILQSANIIKNELHCEREVVDLFKSLIKGTNIKLEDHYDLFKDMKAVSVYHKRKASPDFYYYRSRSNGQYPHECSNLLQYSM